MKHTLFNGSTPVYLELEENGYKPKLSLTHGDSVISAELTDTDIEVLSNLFGSPDVEKLEANITKLEGENDDLAEDIEELEDELYDFNSKNEDLERENDGLKDQISDLTKKIEELEKQLLK